MPRLTNADWASYRRRLVAFARTFGGAVAAAPEDAAHEVILRATAGWDRYDGKHAFATWLYRIARNYCIDVNRAAARRETIIRGNARGLVDGQRREPGPERSLDQSVEAEAVRAAVAALRPSDRRICFLRYYEDLSLRDIASVVGVPVGTVKYRLHVTLRRLRRRLEEELE